MSALIKAIFFDLDGTLLNHKREITQLTRLTLEKCKENGISLFVATARPPLLDRMLSWDHNTLVLFDGGVYYNGGCIQIRDQKDYLPVSAEIVQEIISHVFKYDALNVALQLEDEKHAFRFPLDAKNYNSWGIAADEAFTLSCANGYATIKMLIFYANLIDSVTRIDAELASSLETICRNRAQFYLTDDGKCIQIMGGSVNKLSSIEKIRVLLGVGKDEIAVFGDDINDIEMLSEYPNSVAMGNAAIPIKKVAGYVTLDNNNEGIYHAIHSIFRLV